MIGAVDRQMSVLITIAELVGISLIPLAVGVFAIIFGGM